MRNGRKLYSARDIQLDKQCDGMFSAKKLCSIGWVEISAIAHVSLSVWSLAVSYEVSYIKSWVFLLFSKYSKSCPWVGQRHPCVVQCCTGLPIHTLRSGSRYDLTGSGKDLDPYSKTLDWIGSRFLTRFSTPIQCIFVVNFASQIGIKITLVSKELGIFFILLLVSIFVWANLTRDHT